MKKIFVTVTLFAAMAVSANAASHQLDQAAGAEQTAVSSNQPTVSSLEQDDIYRAHVLQSEEVDKHIIRFYDVDRIVIQNKDHALIRIYDDKWRLIEQSDTDIDKYVRAGNYIITSTCRIRGNYLR